MQIHSHPLGQVRAAGGEPRHRPRGHRRRIPHLPHPQASKKEEMFFASSKYFLGTYRTFSWKLLMGHSVYFNTAVTSPEISRNKYFEPKKGLDPLVIIILR